MTRSRKAWTSFLLTRVGGFLIDLAALAFSYFGAFVLRFEFQSPRWGWRAVAFSFIVVAVVHFAAFVASGGYSVSWRRFRWRDLRRFVIAIAAACVVMTAMRAFLPYEDLAHIRPPFSITLITFLLVTVTVTGWRMVWSWLALSRADDEKLLEREVRTMDAAPTLEFFRGRTVMVTGAGGSIGSEIVRQLSSMNVARIVLVERCEKNLYDIDRELRGLGFRDFVPLMKDAGSQKSMSEVLEKYRPEVILHAAAYKHVPMVEANPEEAWRNNTEATASLAALAVNFGVKRFVLISTDKAVNPVSVMGRTKLAAEREVMKLNGGECSFCAVRFGNVLGSSGSVVPLFREQIAKGGPVTVTDERMMRYFMSIREAVGLVLQAATRSECAIYTLDMGKPVKIVDLAEDMIRQMGYKPYVDIPIVFTGMRPGEKLFEELDISEKSAYRTEMAKIYIKKENNT